MENTLELTLQVNEDYQDIIIADLFELGFAGFEQHSEIMKAFVVEDIFNTIPTQVLEDILDSFGGISIIKEKKVHVPKNWNEEFEKSIQPIQVGRFYIRPTWAESDCPSNAIELLIDPKMSFGTGYHETTRLMLNSISTYIQKDDELLDVGTGTGILAIAAIKLGANYAFGFDIDEWSSENSLENIQLNKVEKSVEIKHGAFETVPDKEFDITIANINRSTILSVKEDILKHTKKGGFILLSGLLTTETHRIKEDELFSGISLIKEISEGDWSGLIYKK